MKLNIDQIRPALPEEWDYVWSQCTYATYFHSREWAEIWSNYHKGRMRPNPLSVVFSDGKKALLPLSCMMSRGSVWSFVSSPDGNCGGWIAVDHIGIEHAVLMKEFLTKEISPRLYWYINPYDDLVKSVGVDINLEDETHVINLEKGFDAVYRNWSLACQRAERKARKSGLLLRIADTEEDWLKYYQAYKDSLRRWGDQALSRYKWALFQEMFDRQSDHIMLWLATTKDDLVVAGALMCCAKTHIVYWHGAALENYLVLRPMNLLFYEIMKDACDKRYRWFDFGPSAGIDGVRRFKESFGATPLDLCYVYVGLANS